MKDTVYICLTPIKNEAWILPLFLKLSSLWADHIIIVDQCSTDESRNIARSHPKVVLIENDNPEYDEAYRQKLLIEAARKIEAKKRILIALDADEALTANWHNSREWEQIEKAQPGTVLNFSWINLLPRNKDLCQIVRGKPYGFIDDGSSHQGQKIHSTRIPIPQDAPRIKLDEVGVLHLQLLAENRALKKRCWYQCWEVSNNTEKNDVFLFRYYNKHLVDETNTSPLQNEWIEDYLQNGIDVFSIDDDSLTWWDKEIIEMFAREGTRKFKKCDIWEVNWQNVAGKLNYNGNMPTLSDPRNNFDKLVHKWLRKTQNTQGKVGNRIIQYILKQIW